VSKASDAHSYIDELGTFVYGVGVIADVIGWVAIFATGRGMQGVFQTLYQQFTLALYLFCWALLAYYVLWWIIPLFVNTIIFFFVIYVVYPVMVIGEFFIRPTVAAAFGIAKTESQQSTYRRRHD